MKKPTREIVVGVTLLVVPFSSIVVGGYLLYKGFKDLKKRVDKGESVGENKPDNSGGYGS